MEGLDRGKNASQPCGWMYCKLDERHGWSDGCKQQLNGGAVDCVQGLREGVEWRGEEWNRVEVRERGDG